MIFWSLFVYPLTAAEDGRVFLAETGKEVHLVRTKGGGKIADKSTNTSNGVRGRDYQHNPGLCELFGGCGRTSPGCTGGVSCRAGRRGGCGPHGHCDRARNVCVCNSNKQDYPHCCYPSCKIDGTCVNGACRCISSGVYPNCEEVCGQGCGKGEICKMIGREAKCVCRQNYVVERGVCRPCENVKNELETTVKLTTTIATSASTTVGYKTDQHIFDHGEITERGITGGQTTYQNKTPTLETGDITTDRNQIKTSRHKTTTDGPKTTPEIIIQGGEHNFQGGQAVNHLGQTTRKSTEFEKGETKPLVGTTQLNGITGKVTGRPLTDKTKPKPTAAITRRKFCERQRTGPMVQKDIDSVKGWIKLDCTGGCIQLYKVRYNCCFNGFEPIPKDLKIANGLCKDKERCEIRDLETTFGHPGCEGERRMWVWYSCNGGKDRTTSIKKNVCHFT